MTTTPSVALSSVAHQLGRQRRMAQGRDLPRRQPATKPGYQPLPALGMFDAKSSYPVPHGKGGSIGSHAPRLLPGASGNEPEALFVAAADASGPPSAERPIRRGRL